MTLRLPKKLSNSPLRETIFEMRFEPAMAAAGDILPGLLYSFLKSDYPEVVPLPLASVPRSIREKTPELLYQHSHSLRGSTSSVQLGDRVLAFHVMEYPGWITFKSKIESLVKAMQETGLVKHVERFSFKYVNLIEASASESQLALMNLRVELVGLAPVERGFQLRVEHEEGKCTTITQVIPNATAKLVSSGKEVVGLLVDVDTIRSDPGHEFWTAPGTFLDEAHAVAKVRFFSLLTESALKRLEPVW
jgi:uncharacterized protein (TIGR04255 family)